MSEQSNNEMIFQIQRIYTKDVSFEAPNAPHVFQKDWQPEVKLDLDTASTQLAASGGFLLWQWCNRGDEVSHEITLAAVFPRSQG